MRAEKLIDSIVNSAHIPSCRRPEIQRELRAHIEDFVDAARQSGRDQAEIEKLLLENFGDPGQIADGFAWVYRQERRTLRALVFAISTMLLAGSLLAGILAAQAGLAFGLGTSITKVLASRHTVIQALDILASVATYLAMISCEDLFGTHRFQKAAALLIVIDAVIGASFAAAGLHIGFLVFGLVNGIFSRAIQLFVTRQVARSAVVVACFPLVGLILTLQRSPSSQVVLLATCMSWLAMGMGYLLMTQLAARVDATLVNRLSGFKVQFPKGVRR